METFYIKYHEEEHITTLHDFLIANLDEESTLLTSKEILQICRLKVGEQVVFNFSTMSTCTLERVEAPVEITNNYVANKVEEIKARVEKNKTALVSTCDARNWNLEEHLHMPAVAEELRKQGYVVNVKVNYGVTDYGISFSGSKSV